MSTVKTDENQELVPEKDILLTVKDLEALGLEDQSALQATLKQAIKSGKDKEVVDRLMEGFLEATDKLGKAATALTESKRAEIDEANFEGLSKDALAKAFDGADLETQKAIYERASKEFGVKAANLVLGKGAFEKALTRPLSAKTANLEELQEIRKAHDLAMILTAASGGVDERKGLNDKYSMNQDIYRQSLARLEAEGLETRGISDALDTATATEGAEWVPTILSGSLLADMYLQLRVASLFPRFNMPSPTYHLPVRTKRARTYRMTQATAVNQYFTSLAQSHTMETDKLVMNADKLGFSQFISDELGQDSILPILQLMRDECVYGMASGIDDAVINGSTLLNDIDNASTDTNRLWNNSTLLDDTRINTGAADVRNAWDGLRKLTNSGARLDFSNVNPTLALIRELRKKMGKYAATTEDLAYIVNPYSHIDLLNIDQVVTLEKFGPQATVKAGEIGKIDNVPIILSEFIYPNLNASGRFDNVTTTRTIIDLVYTKGFGFGDRQNMVIETGRNPLAGQSYLLTTWRGDFIKLFPSAENVIAEGYNVKY